MVDIELRINYLIHLWAELLSSPPEISYLTYFKILDVDTYARGDALLLVTTTKCVSGKSRKRVLN